MSEYLRFLKLRRNNLGKQYTLFDPLTFLKLAVRPIERLNKGSSAFSLCPPPSNICISSFSERNVKPRKEAIRKHIVLAPLIYKCTCFCL